MRTDVYNYQTESNENDNVYTQAINIASPNLIISNVTAPTTATAGQTITLSWTGKNDSSVTTVSSNWYDRVVFSKNDIYGDSDDIYLTERYISSSNGLPLEPNETYTVSSTVTLPSSVVSNGYLLVRTDVYNYQTESNENDNVYAQAIDITAPNLIITNFTSPSTASTRQTIALSWTVQNQGTGVTNTSSWYDRIVFSSDTVFGNGDDIYLTEILASTFANLPLDPDEAYNVTQNITLPDTVAGNGYLLVKTDNYNWQLESNKTDNIRSVAIAVNAPNLVISNPTSPPSAAVLGQTLPLSWRVTNTGTVSALAGWYDRVYLSDDALLDNNDLNIGEFFRPNSLAPNASYTNNRNIFLPATSIGDRYLLFVTDVYRGQGETNETDNIIATPITLTAPDLTVTAATAPTTAVTSGTLNVSWTVTNGGDVVASADWSDEVRLSTNTIWGDSDDRSITSGTVSIAAQTPLNPNSSYTIERTVTLPSVVAGNYNLLFRADSSNQQGETNENNNVRSLPIAIAVPDLVVAAAAAPTNGIASQSIAVSWTVTNQGTVDAAADWYDSVYLSTNNTFEGFNDIRIASDLISTQTPLLAGNSYTFTRNVTLPNRPAGDYFLLFLADDAYWWGNSQRETDENNNVRAVPITIGVPDLTVSAATAPSSGVLGGAIDVSWTVTNTSTVTAPADWSDRIYFSTDEVWNPSSDTLITSEAIATQTPLNAGLSYTVNRTITLPNVASSGSGYLLFVADANANQAESNENNNVRSVPFTLNAPNLTVTGATAPSSVSLGSTIAVTWTVANSGLFPANADWYDSVYLSDDATFNGGSDRYLGARWAGSNTPLATGSNYTGTLNITLPTTTTGNRFLLFVADDAYYYGNGQGETNENDNTFALPINISSADLVVESAIAPSGGIIGNPITLSWTVKNQGTGEAPQDWRDYVYLSLNQTLDGSDTLLVNEAISTQTPLAADGSYTINKTVNLASITPGTRYLIFVADGSGNQGEINETNNQRVVEIVVTAPDLIVSTANAPTTAITGSNIAVSWTTSNQGTSEASADWSDAVYLSGDSLLDGSDIFITSEAIASQTPLAAGASYTISRNIALPSNVSGDRFLLFVADNSNAQGEVDNTNNVRAVPIGINASAILSFSAATFRVNEDGTAIAPVTIERSGIITESVSVTLNLSNGTAIAGSDYNSSPLTVTFAPGETSKTVTIPIVNDTRFEPEETVNLTLSNPSAGAVIGVQNTAVLTIVSDDLPVYGKLSFSNAQFTVQEDGGAILAVTVIRTEGSDGNVGATINLTDGTAIAPGDYNNASVTVNFTQGETSKTIVIPIVNDAIYEPDETINLTLTNPTGGATLGSQTTATLTILDNDPPQQGILSFSQSSYSINENGTAVTQVTVMRSGGSDGEVSATINLFNGSATAPSDYNSSPIIVNFANGETSKTVVIPIVNDTVYEANETINLTLSNPTGGAIIRGQNTAVVTIVDDDIELNFSSGTYNAGENGVPAAQVTVNRAGITSVPVGVTLLLRNGTATAPDDYLDTPIAVTFAPGETSKTVTIPIVDDEQLEANETILLSLVDPTNGATLGSQATASLTIASDDLPDLVVSNIVAPTSTQSGKAIDITWTLKNQGNANASGTWTDYVYLSNDATIGNDQLLGSFSFTGVITVGSSIDRTQSIFLPLTLSGEHRIIIQTNADNRLKERPGTGNNNRTIDDLPINIISNLANLQVSSIIPPATAFSSQETVVEWIVTNTGVGPTNASIWYDQVWLSLDYTLDHTDIYLGQAKNASFLNPNESYRNSLVVTLPQGIEGNYHFLVRTNFSLPLAATTHPAHPVVAGPILEINENDNVGSSTVTQINLTPSPDLQITAVSTPTQTFSGQPMLLTWNVTNKGNGRTLLSNRIIDTFTNASGITTEVQLSNNNRSLAWYDKVYMSSDEVLDADDRYLGQYLRTGNLNPNESYTANLTVDLPIGISGDYYFLIQTDANNQIFEGIQEGNNTGYDTPATIVKLTPPPDLEIEFIQSPTQATASRSLSFTYRVTNFGATVTPNKFWTDTFYLSTDNQLDLQTDLRLGSNPRYSSLTPDDAYTNTVSYTLPNTITGTYYLFGVTDSNNEVFELDNTNNIGIARTTITISSRPADLTVAVTTSSTAEAGKSLTVNWTVTNQGTGDTAVSNWNDRILLSADNIIGNSDDIFLGNFTRNGLLNIGESYSRSGVFNLPFTLIGNYNLFVITDSVNQVYEANNEGNNGSSELVM
ncbi:CARDB domain-containing protein [Microcystis aeruginosa]|uniref:Na-Ca exchanger/integrin-beta4 n=1 Tax=Microcystis aeruginosa PCC 9443 TaxID=1160281 RepID=I4G5A0_MICAE